MEDSTLLGPGVNIRECRAKYLFSAQSRYDSEIGRQSPWHTNNNREAGMNNLLRFWNDLSIWNKCGLSMVLAVALLSLLIIIF